jgi:hypothetical protein
MPFLPPDASQACGAMNRHGEPCRNWPARRSTGVRRRCRFHGGHSLKGRAHPGFTHGYRSRVLREVAEIWQKGAVFSLWEAIVLTEQVREKRAELVALVHTLEEIKMAGMTNAELRAYLRLPLSPCDVVLR